MKLTNIWGTIVNDSENQNILFIFYLIQFQIYN